MFGTYENNTIIKMYYKSITDYPSIEVPEIYSFITLVLKDQTT